MVRRGEGSVLVALFDTFLDEFEAEFRLPQEGVAMDLARSVVRMVVRQRLEKILTEVAVGIASGKPVAECLVPAFDDLGAVMGASVVALCPRESPPLLRRTGPIDPEFERRLFCDGIGASGWAVLHAPVELYGNCMANLSVVRRADEPFAKEEKDVVSRLASLVALAWATEGYQHQLAEIARLRERERIADALHDRVAQILFAAQLGLDTMLETAPSEAETERLTEIRALLTKGDIAIREVIHQLTTAVAEPTLARRLRLEVEAVEDEFGVAIHVELPTDEELSVVPRRVADAVVKIAREGTVNAAKHGGPCRIALDLHVSEYDVVIAVVDDGIGAQPAPRARAGHGLGSIDRLVRDMGGDVSLTVRDCGLGTCLQAVFPL
jgi:signal transduction histidine kinase